MSKLGLEILEGRIVPSVSVLVRYASTPAVPPGAAVAPNLVPNLYKVEAPDNLPLKKFLGGRSTTRTCSTPRRTLPSASPWRLTTRSSAISGA